MESESRNLCLGTFSERFLVENTPSRLDGIESNSELNFRQKTSCLIYDAIVEIKLPAGIADRAVVLMQHFYMYHSFRKVQYQLTAAACVFVAAKMECSSFPIHVLVCAFAEILGVDAETLRSYEFEDSVLYLEATVLKVFGTQVGHAEAPCSALDTVYQAYPECVERTRRVARFAASYAIAVSWSAVRYNPAQIAVACVVLAIKCCSSCSTSASSCQADLDAFRESIVASWHIDPSEFDTCAQIAEELLKSSTSCHATLRRALVGALSCAFDARFDEALARNFGVPVEYGMLERRRALRYVEETQRRSIEETQVRQTQLDAPVVATEVSDKAHKETAEMEVEKQDETAEQRPRRKVSIGEYKERLMQQRKAGDSLTCSDFLTPLPAFAMLAPARPSNAPKTDLHDTQVGNSQKPNSAPVKSASHPNATLHGSTHVPVQLEADENRGPDYNLLMAKLRDAMRVERFRYDPLQLIYCASDTAGGKSDHLPITPDGINEPQTEQLDFDDYDGQLATLAISRVSSTQVDEIILLSDSADSEPEPDVATSLKADVNANVKTSPNACAKSGTDELSEGEIVEEDDGLVAAQRTEDKCNDKTNQTDQIPAYPASPGQTICVSRSRQPQLTYDALLNSVSSRLNRCGALPQFQVTDKRCFNPGQGTCEARPICISSSDEEDDSADADLPGRALPAPNDSPRWNMMPLTPTYARGHDSPGERPDARFSPSSMNANIRDMSNQLNVYNRHIGGAVTNSETTSLIPKRDWRTERYGFQEITTVTAPSFDQLDGPIPTWLPDFRNNMARLPANPAPWPQSQTGWRVGNVKPKCAVAAPYSCLRNEVRVPRAPLLRTPRPLMTSRQPVIVPQQVRPLLSVTNMSSLVAFSDEELCNELRKRQHFANLLDDSSNQLEQDIDASIFVPSSWA